MKHQMGSCYFFSNMPGFSPHDHDFIELVDTNEFLTRCIRGHGKDYFFFKRKSKEKMIVDALQSSLPMVVGKFLIPEFCKEIGFGVEDLKQLHPQFEKLDPKHEYEKIIYDSYLENGAMTLTDEQRAAAYDVYLKARMPKEERGK